MEQSHFFYLCLLTSSQEEVIEHFFPLMGLRPNLSLLKQRLNLLQLDKTTQAAIHHGRISDKLVGEYVKLSPEDQTSLRDLFLQLEMGGNKQRRFLGLCKDHMMRKQKSLSLLIREEELQAILTHEEMNAPQKCSQLLQVMQQRCSPLHTAAKEKFKQDIQKMQLPKNLAISHSPSFEKDEVHLSIRFDNFANCKKIVPLLRKFLGTYLRKEESQEG